MSTPAVRAVPVIVVDVVAAAYLIRVWHRAPVARRGDLAALPLGLFFASLAGLAFCQLMMSSMIDVRQSFLWNHMGQSVCAALSVPPLVAFSLRYLATQRPRGERFVVLVCVALALLVCAAFIIDAVSAREVRYDFVYTHTRRTAETEGPWQALITGFASLGYCASLAALGRRAWSARGARRWRVLAFAGVVLACIGAIAVNRVEVLGLVPPGVYATYVVWLTLAAIVLFMGSTDEITSFRERTVALVLVAGLALLATVSQRSVESVREQTKATRRALAPAVLAGFAAGDGAVHAAPLAASSASGAGAQDERVEGSAPATARIIEVVDGGAVSFPYLAERRALHEAIVPLALLLLASVLGIVVVIPVLAQWSVLGPLAALTRAEEQSRAKSMFLAQMSHELKTPLHAILFHARSLLGPVPTQERDRRARTIERAAEHLRALIDNLLTSGLGDLRSLKPRATPVSLRELVDRVVEGHRAAAEAKALSLKATVHEVERALLDDNLVRQVLDNLVGNAIKYTDHGAVEVDVAKRAGMLVFTVIDTGRGIPLAVQRRVFEPFFQHEPREGVGLGLAIVQEIVGVLGGALQLDSTPGRGTTMRVSVPHVPVEQEQAGEHAPQAKALVLPPARDIDELAALARVGDVVAVGALARQLLASALPEHQPFYTSASELAARCQVRALRRLFGDESAAQPEEPR